MSKRVRGPLFFFCQLTRTLGLSLHLAGGGLGTQRNCEKEVDTSKMRVKKDQHADDDLVR